MSPSSSHQSHPLSSEAEARRLRVAQGFRFLVDSRQGARHRAILDGICELARDALAVDQAYVGLMLEDGFHVIASAGLSKQAIPRETTFCDRTIAHGAPLVVDDLQADALLRAWPPGARFYAGFPLLHAQQAVGTFCVTAAQPRPMPERHRRQLAKLAQLAIETLALAAEQRHAEEGWDRALTNDSLTGIPNQVRLMAAVDELCEGGVPGLLVIVGLDGFKTVNESMGRAEGDAVLRAVGRRLASELEDEGTVGRLGGDEFGLVLFGERTHVELLALTRRIAGVVERASTVHGTRAALSASLGVAAYPADAGTTYELLQSAEIALRSGKAQGGRQAGLFTPALRERIESRASVLREVTDGIGSHEFVLHYQPICTPQGASRGFEALMRWQHPQRGLLGPYHFMAAFEDPALSLKLGDLALTQAIAQMRAWRVAGLDFGYVAVNLSGAQLAEANLATTIERRLRDAQVSPRQLMLEITETVYLEDKNDTVRSTLRALRALGVAFALDDFGTGHASLSHLLKLEVDRIKIDMSFVRLIGKSAGTDAIVTAIVTMGSALHLQVVAEGVETPAQLAFLQGVGCELIQGYLFAKPMDAESAGAFCAATT